MYRHRTAIIYEYLDLSLDDLGLEDRQSSAGC